MRVGLETDADADAGTVTNTGADAGAGTVTNTGADAGAGTVTNTGADAVVYVACIIHASFRCFLCKWLGDQS